MVRVDWSSAVKHLEGQSLALAQKTGGARKIYPGSKHGEAVLATRRSADSRLRSYGTDAMAEIVARTDLEAEDTLEATGPEAETRRRQRGLPGFEHPLADRNLPELQMASRSDGCNFGALVMGGPLAGKTALCASLAAAATGTYEKSKAKQHEEELPPLGAPRPEIHLSRGRSIVLTDTRSSGPLEDFRMITEVHPSSTRSFTCLPQWLRLALRQRSMQSVVIVLDGTQPIWLETTRLADHVARLCSVLLGSGYVVALAVTKLVYLRGAMVDLEKLGNPNRIAQKWEVDEAALLCMPPKRCYETFVWTYLEKTQSAIQVAAAKLNYPLPRGWPRLNRNLLDVLTFRGAQDFREWKEESRATYEQPNFLYAMKQLNILTESLLPEPTEADVARRLDFDRPHVS